MNQSENRKSPVRRGAPAPASREEAREQRKLRREKTRNFMTSGSSVRYRGGIDRPMLVLIILLLCYGTVMVFSASYVFALQREGDSYYYIVRQLLFAVAGVATMLGVSLIDYRIIQYWTPVVFLGVSLLLLVTPFFGIAQGVARRWLIIGPIRFQPSELMKPMLVLMLAWYYARYQNIIMRRDNFWRCSMYSLFIPFMIVGFVCFLIFLENHFSCMVIMFLIGLVVIWAGGAVKIWFALAGAGAGVVSLFAIMFSSYARERIDIWLHPEKYSADDEVWQTIQGLNAVGSGGFFGVGLGNSRQKHLYVAEPQNDFIFSILCEELGFVGALSVIVLFVLFVVRGYHIAMNAPSTFSSLMVMGLVGKVAIQAVLNMAVVTAMIPNTGIALPFFSYGGTALLVQLAEMGLILNVSRYSVREVPQ